MRTTGPERLDTTTEHLPDSEAEDERQHFIFYQDNGGLRATDEANDPMDTIYYLGIIDICTPYTTFKRAEHIWKGLHADRVRVHITLSSPLSLLTIPRYTSAQDQPRGARRVFGTFLLLPQSGYARWGRW